MSNNQDWYDEDDFDFEDEGTVTEQRGRNDDDVLKKVRRAERAKDKQLKELQGELEELRRFRREVNVSKVLSDKGVNQKVAALIPQDVDPSAEGINQWLEQYGEIFGVTVEEATPASQVDQADLEALKQMNAATSGASVPEGATNLSSQIQNAQTKEELLALKINLLQ